MTRDEIRALVSGPGKTSRWITRHLDYAEPDWCLIYPFAWEVDHYPKYRNQPGRHYPVHRLMCEYRHGPPPTPKHQSAHCCNRGTQGCVNPMHVEWKTNSENQKDRYKSGRPTRRERLTPEQVDEIRALQDRARPADIAKQYGVTLRNVRLIFEGKTWRDTSAKRLFSEDEVAEIRALAPLIKRGSEFTTEKIAERYGATYSQIRRIMVGKSYAWVER